ncbi:MAG: TetR family transcriptional regulator [Bacteroidales bacterium]|nr:TetR family transcriptional regulator [Bacteroidales bacterium]
MEETLKNIIEKVTALYLRYGIKSVTMDDVARHLGVSKKTLYTYVKDKNELVERVVDGQIEEHINQDTQLKSQNLSALQEMLLVFKKVSELLQEINPSYQYDLNKYYPQLCDKFMGFKKGQLYQNIRENLIKGKKEGIYRKEINEDIIAKMNTDRNMAMFSESDDHHAWFNKETFKEVFFYHMHAIINDHGRNELKQQNFFQNT